MKIVIDQSSSCLLISNASNDPLFITGDIALQPTLTFPQLYPNRLSAVALHHSVCSQMFIFKPLRPSLSEIKPHTGWLHVLLLTCAGSWLQRIQISTKTHKNLLSSDKMYESSNNAPEQCICNLRNIFICAAIKAIPRCVCKK